MEVEEERKREMGEDELEARVKPEFERKIHRPHIKVDNWREVEGEKMSGHRAGARHIG